MNTENAIKSAIGFFLITVLGSLLSALLGGIFGATVATISPELAQSLFNETAAENITRYAFAVGMIWGLFIGAAVSGFACFLAAIIKILRIRFEYNANGKKANTNLEPISGS